MQIRSIPAAMAMGAALAATACSAQAADAVQPVLTDGSVPYAKYGAWTLYQTGTEAFDGALTCAAVANLPGSYDAIRIERGADGYAFGVNGFDRASFGENGEYPLTYWFHTETPTAAEGMGRFIKDPAFPDDDWLSAYASMEDLNGDSPFSDIYSADEITFEIENPGNRTGEDAVRMTFPVGTGEILLRALDQCYEMGLRYAENTEGPIAPCRDDGLRLPLSGLCESAANALIEVADGPEPQLAADSCEWTLGEAWLSGMMVLYRAAECSDRVSRLYGGAGAHIAQLELIETAYAEDGSAFGKLEEPVPYADVFTRFKNSPAADVTARALYGLQGQVAKSCAARKSDRVADGYIVDVSKAERARQPQDEPPASLCGEYGAGEDGDLWRVFQGHAAYLRLGQDAYQDIDYRSLTLIEPDGEGGWRLVS